MKLAGLAAFSLLSFVAGSAAAVSSVDLSGYQLVARYALPEPTRDSAPPASLLAQEASAVTWNRDTNSLFVVGDGGTSVVQVSLTGQLIDSMTLAQDASQPQGTAFYDPEALTYVGNNQFVMVEERYRIANLFTYAANTTLGKVDAQSVKLGTTIGNIGIEGISYDPLTSGFIAVKEQTPIGVFQTTIDFANGTASNGSPSTVNSTNLFDPTTLGVADLADVFALSNLTGIDAGDQDHLLLLSQESGKVLEVDRAGTIYSSLTIPLEPNTGGLSVANQQHEGITMDDAGFIYMVAENGGGSINDPQLWVYAPVPEPGTGALIGIGLVLLAVRRRSEGVFHA
jgi:uncharacterized protein YjiK